MQLPLSLCAQFLTCFALHMLNYAMYTKIILRRGLCLFFIFISLTACASRNEGEVNLDGPASEETSRVEEANLDGLAFEATSQIGKDTVRDVEFLEFTAFVTNESSAPKELEYSYCALKVAAYPTAARTGKSVWDGERFSDIPYECPVPLFLKTLESGERWTPPQFTERYDLNEIPLEDGHYYFTVRVSLNWTETEALPAGDIFLDTPFTP